jgi:hypothetical protein
VLLHPSAPDPTEGHLELRVEDGSTLRQESVAGFGSAGEAVDYEWTPEGAVARVRLGGSSAWPVEVFRARRAQQLADAPAV